MQPIYKTYRLIIDSKGRHGDELYLTKAHDTKTLRFHSFGDEEHLTLPYMSLDEAASWFRKAADLIENAKLD